LTDFENLYSSIPADELHEPHPTIGSPCVARFTEDGLNYRAKIISIVEEITIIYFVDYGNQQQTPLSELKRMLPDFMVYPEMVF
jgi:tudor domain-containing protein 1/4/6/7